MLSRIVALIALLTTSIASAGVVVKPKKFDDFYKVTGRVYSANGRSGGSTFVVSSSATQGSELVTNHHVCQHFASTGAFVAMQNKKYQVTSMVFSKEHDLCMLHVREDLHYQVKIADKDFTPGDMVTVAGNPKLLPLIIVKGYASLLQIGEEELVGKDVKSRILGVLVQPGNSGSAAFNDQGEAVEVVFAMKADPDSDESIGYAYAVPQSYLKKFVDEECKHLQWTRIPYALSH